MKNVWLCSKYKHKYDISLYFTSNNIEIYHGVRCNIHQHPVLKELKPQSNANRYKEQRLHH